MGLDDDPQVEDLQREAAEERAAPLARRERLVEVGLGLVLVAAVIALAVFVPGPRAFDPLVAAALVAGLAVARRATFATGGGEASAVAALVAADVLLLPPWAAVLVAVLGNLVARLPDHASGGRHPDRALLVLGDSCYVIAPALVVGLWAPAVPSLEAWPVYLAVLGAQLAGDMAVTVLRCRLALGVPPLLVLRLQPLVAAVDVALAPIGLLVAIEAATRPAALVLVVPLMGLLAALGNEREQRLEQARDLSFAYRGTALLLGDVLEADDAYTGGEHSQGVVALAEAVGRELRLDARRQRDLEFGALLHDIGKLRVPDEILHKPGPLDASEWEVIRQHPADGQNMLDQVGGVLARVGRIVRGHHERWDGGGYPDGLAGEAIPLEARIIAVCDAYNAMTTNRPYRSALPVAVALEELRSCTGSQFDPQVVDALVHVVGEPAPAPAVLALAAAA